MAGRAAKLDDMGDPVHLDAVLDGLARNPALPVELVRRLLPHRGGFEQVARRADLTDDVIEEIIAADRDWQIRALAGNRTLPDRFRLLLAAHPDAATRCGVVIGCGQDTGREVYERLAADPAAEVREHLAESGHAPQDVLAGLAADEEPKVRATLAKWWTQAPEPVRRRLLTDPHDDVRAAACSIYHARLPHPVPPPDLVPALLADPVTREGAVRHAVMDGEIAARLVQDPDPLVRRQLAEHPDLPPEVRDALGTDPWLTVQLGIFARPDTPEPLRAAIHARITAAPDLLDLDPELADYDRDFDHFMASTELDMLRLDWVVADPLPHVSSPYLSFRVAAARAEGLPPDVVAALLNDPAAEVRSAAFGRNRHLVDVTTAERIDREHRNPKRGPWRPADVFAFPAETLRRFATDPDPRMRCLAPRDPDLPAELCARLAADPDSRVREAVAGHHNLNPRVLVELLSDGCEGPARAAAGSLWLPVRQMERLLALAGR